MITQEFEYKYHLKQTLDEKAAIEGALVQHPEHDELLHKLADINNHLGEMHSKNPFWYNQTLKEKGLI